MTANIKTNCLYAAIVLLLSWFTYFHNYDSPGAFYWDEKYHVASAERYRHGIFFLETHPPLGKQLIALGEEIFRANEKQNPSQQFQFLPALLDTQIVANTTGYRFFPVLLSWLGALVFFLILLEIFRNPFYAALFSSLYIFDNALLLHNRGAMIDGPMLFFSLLFLLLLLKMWRHFKKYFTIPLHYSLLLGLCFGAMAAIKFPSLILGLLLVPSVFLLKNRSHKKRKMYLKTMSAFLAAFLLVFMGSWAHHLTSSKYIFPMFANEGLFLPKLDSIELSQQQIISKKMLPLFWDNLRYMYQEQKTIVSEDRNSSLPTEWPFGGRSIVYRSETRDFKNFKFLILAINPVTWLFGLLGVLGGLTLFAAKHLFSLNIRIQNQKPLFLLLGVYLFYQTTLLFLPRALYLPHYFLPLILSYLMGALVVNELLLRFKDNSKKLLRMHGLMAIQVLMTVILFFYFSPLTYNKSLTLEELNNRAWLKNWKMEKSAKDLMAPAPPQIPHAPRHFPPAPALSPPAKE